MCDMSSIDRNSSIRWLFHAKNETSNNTAVGNGGNYLSFGANIHILMLRIKPNTFNRDVEQRNNIAIIIFPTFALTTKLQRQKKSSVKA
jgi:hypothetical protein